MLTKIYDNGALLLGNIKDIINYIENDERLEAWEYEDLLKDLYDIKDIAEIVMVNYENPMGYNIDFWRANDNIDYNTDNN